MEINYIKIKTELLYSFIDKEGKSIDDLKYYFELRGSMPDIILEKKEGYIAVKNRKSLVKIAKSLKYNFMDAVVFNYDEFGYDKYIEKGEVILSSIEESRKKEDLENKGMRLDLIFFEMEIKSEELKKTLFFSVSHFFKRSELVDLNLQLLNCEFIEPHNCLRLDLIYPSVVEARNTAILYGEMIKMIHQISSIRSVNGNSVDHILSS